MNKEDISIPSLYPTVSVVMPCYNDGDYILDAVNSIKMQSYPQIELIIIDDGSDDEKTADILKMVNYRNLKVLRTNHLRPAGARNYGIKEASGKYILPLDADDTIESSYIEKAVIELESDSNIGIVYCHADLFGCENGRWDLPDYSLKKEIIDNCIFVR